MPFKSLNMHIKPLEMQNVKIMNFATNLFAALVVVSIFNSSVKLNA